MSSDFLETSMPTTGEDGSRCVESCCVESCVMASLPCGCELGLRAGPFNRLFGLAMRGERRSRFVATSTVTILEASWHDRSVIRRRFAGLSLRFDAREAESNIESEMHTFGNIQGTKTRRATGCSKTAS